MLRIKDIMTADVLTVSPELSLRDTMELLASRHVSGVPVVAGRRVLGVVSMTDLIAFAAALPGVPTERPGEVDLDDWPKGDDDEDDGDLSAGKYFMDLWTEPEPGVDERFTTTRGNQWNALEEHTVEEAMTPALHALPPDTDVPAAAGFMSEHGIHRLLVIENEELLGIVTTTDITRAVAAGRLVKRTYVFPSQAAY